MAHPIDKNLFAFWKYDQFPYLLGGTVTKLTDEGWVETIEYGPGNRFLAVKILPVGAGKKLNEKLRRMKTDRDSALDKVIIEWDETLKALVDF